MTLEDQAPATLAEAETRAILEAAGATKIRVEQYRADYWLVACREFGAGVTSDKDEAFDTPQEVAEHLVRCGSGASRETPRETSAELNYDWLGAELLAAARDEESVHVAEGALSGDATAEVLADADADQADDADPNEDAGADVQPSERSDIIPPPLQAELAPEPEPEPQPEDGTPSVAIFGDNLPAARLLRIAQLSGEADARRAAIRTEVNEQLGEYPAVMAHVVTHMNAAGAYVGGQQAIADRFYALDAAYSRERAIEAFRQERVAFIREADRAAVEAFDPAEGWPA